jgi:hypothetical protein
MLDDVAHTSNGPGYLEGHVAEYRGTVFYVDAPKAIRTRDIITAPAPAPASFAQEVLIAAGLAPVKAEELRRMLAAEHAAN